MPRSFVGSFLPSRRWHPIRVLTVAGNCGEKKICGEFAWAPTGSFSPLMITSDSSTSSRSVTAGKPIAESRIPRLWCAPSPLPCAANPQPLIHLVSLSSASGGFGPRRQLWEQTSTSATSPVRGERFQGCSSFLCLASSENGQRGFSTSDLGLAFLNFGP